MTRMTQLSSLLIATLLLGACSDDSHAPPLDKGTITTDGDPCAAETCNTTALLPGDKKVADYVKGAPEAAVSPVCVQRRIDGGSVKYEQNKFVCLTRVIYTSAGASTEIELWAFDQTDATGAKGAMDIAADGCTDLTPTIGDASSEITAVSTYTAFARKGKTLVRVVANKKAAKDDAVALLKLIINAAP